MSLLYKDKKDVEYSVDIKQSKGNINLLFSSDCGKFGTDEILDEHDLTVEQLLHILQESDEKQCDINGVGCNKVECCGNCHLPLDNTYKIDRVKIADKKYNP